jgi:putative transposase
MDQHEKRLKRYQRRLARCQKGSANRAKARLRVARQHARVADARREFLHKASTDLVRRFATGRVPAAAPGTTGTSMPRGT